MASWTRNTSIVEEGEITNPRKEDEDHGRLRTKSRNRESSRSLQPSLRHSWCRGLALTGYLWTLGVTPCFTPLRPASPCWSSANCDQLSIQSYFTQITRKSGRQLSNKLSLYQHLDQQAGKNKKRSQIAVTHPQSRACFLMWTLRGNLGSGKTGLDI